MSEAGTGRAVTRPTIAMALAQFLAEQEQRLAPRTVTQCRDVVELLQHYLNATRTRHSFQITRIEPGKVWLAGLIDGRECGPIQLPEELGRLCQVGWRFSGAIGRIGRRWQLLEAWNVYPL